MRRGWRGRSDLADGDVPGQVKAVGTHAQLVASDPLYAELAATQFLVSADA